MTLPPLKCAACGTKQRDVTADEFRCPLCLCPDAKPVADFEWMVATNKRRGEAIPAYAPLTDD